MYARTTENEARVAAEASCVEHQILDHVKQALRVTVAWKAPAFSLSRKVASLQFTAKSFVRHLRRMMDLEERDGYMNVVREEKPYMEHRVQRLERQHAEFRERLESLEPEVAALPALPNERIQIICKRILELLDQVDQHDDEEITLLQETMLCDDGGEG